MKPIERVIAEGTHRGGFIASGCFGRVYNQGDKRVYKRALTDGTALWLERCLAIQTRLGADHPLCEFMPIVYSFSIDNDQKCYSAVMERYVLIKYDTSYPAGYPSYNDIPKEVGGFDERTAAAKSLARRVNQQCNDVIGRANDLHGGNILWCPRTKRWVVVDPSSEGYHDLASNPIDLKFTRAKRVVTQYGSPRRQ